MPDQHSETPIRDDLRYRASRVRAIVHYLVDASLIVVVGTALLFALKPLLVAATSEQGFGGLLWGWALLAAYLCHTYGKKF